MVLSSLSLVCPYLKMGTVQYPHVTELEYILNYFNIQECEFSIYHIKIHQKMVGLAYDMTVY